jgi:hypothetical protein
MPRKAIDMTGNVFGRLIVIERSGKHKNGEIMWKCKCECGNLHFSTGAHLRDGDVLSCGCLSIELRTKHGKHDTPEYHAWEAIKNRCTSEANINWKHYGGRGIYLCESWNDFEQFFLDMGERPSRKHSIDRIDNSLGYFKENCRWATQTEQMRNYRLNRLLTLDSVTKCVSEWAEFLGINKSTLAKRLSYGWSVEKCLTTPVIKRNRIY